MYVERSRTGSGCWAAVAVGNADGSAPMHAMAIVRVDDGDVKASAARTGA
jgi:hypothetical protein